VVGIEGIDTRALTLSLRERGAAMGIISPEVGRLKELKEKGNIDLIHCLYPNSSVLGAALFKRMSPKTRIVYDIRSPWVDMSIEKKNSMPKFAVPLYRNTAYLSERFLTKYVDGFIFITEGLKKFYEKKIRLNSKPFSIIPSGVDLDLFSKKSSGTIRDKYQLKNGEFLIGYVGVLSRMRELDFVLRALQKLADSGKNYRVMFVGGGEDKERLEKRAKEFKVGDKVIFTGQVPYETIPDYISTFDAAICHLPDKLIFKYSFPMKVLEYLACDIPVLASDIEAHTEIAKCVEGIFLYKDQHDIEISIRKMNNKKTGVSPTNYRWEIITQEIAKLSRRQYEYQVQFQLTRLVPGLLQQGETL